jgi:hypothetical protein
MPKIQLRRGTASEWTSANPTLSPGEIGFETDTGKFKIGTSTATAWTSLGYAQSGASSSLANALSVSGAIEFASGTTFDGSASRTLQLASTITSNTSGNAATATTLATSRNINGTSFNGSANVAIPGAVYGTTVSGSSNFRNIYVTQSTPSSPQNGDVWISW